MCFLSLRERHVSSQFDDFSQRIHLAFTNVHLLIASRSPCSLCALILPRQTPFHFHSLEEEGAVMRALRECKAVFDRDLAILDSWRRDALVRVAAANAE